MRDAGMVGRLVSRAAGEPYANRHRPDVSHPLGGEADTVGKHASADIRFGHGGNLPA
jgi:hypothetical protein